ncbi:MAG: hypothetical protein MRJ65_01825 [Candidatus Brocadiaceae bacterium]|nr:hypothetical protein [Candidatus Brocadiaceae bacterium]
MEEDKDYEAYKTYLGLWESENPIKTNKLQVLLIVNGLLVSAVQVAGGFTRDNWFLFLAGASFSFIWVLSIGRTSLFQKVWQTKAKAIAEKTENMNDPRFQAFNTEAEEEKAPIWLRILGSIPSKYYLLGAPVLFSIIWFALLLYVLFTS